MVEAAGICTLLQLRRKLLDSILSATRLSFEENRTWGATLVQFYRACWSVGRGAMYRNTWRMRQTSASMASIARELREPFDSDTARVMIAVIRQQLISIGNRVVSV
jgi:hypothetical protein